MSTGNLDYVFSLYSDSSIRPPTWPLTHSILDSIGTKNEMMPCIDTICHIYGNMTRMVSKQVTKNYPDVQTVEGLIIGALCAAILMCVMYTIVKAVKWRRKGR